MTPQLRLIHLVARWALAFVFVWHGLVPKLVYDSPMESAMLIDAGLSLETAHQMVRIGGWLEIAFALLLIGLWNASWPLWLVAIGMPATTLALAITSPILFREAFNPMSLNASVTALAVVALLSARRKRSEPW